MAATEIEPTAAAVSDLGHALLGVVGKGPVTGKTDRELLKAVSRCLCTVLHAANEERRVDAGGCVDINANCLALRLTSALNGLLANCCDRSLATEVRVPLRLQHRASGTAVEVGQCWVSKGAEW